MFAGFNLSLDKTDLLLDSYHELGLSITNSNNIQIEKDLKSYICETGELNGSLMQETWFPNVKADIFLSHSHKDEDMVISLAGWLYENCGITSFIDSSVWGYANNLLKIIDNDYCVQSQTEDGRITYDYEKRNGSTSHVHMMLSMALTKMIDRTECLFFINTPSSISVSNSIHKSSTLSPWIYAELQISEIVRHKKLYEYRGKSLTEDRSSFEHSALAINYDVSLDHLTNITNSDLIYMEKHRNLRKPSLDILYEHKDLLPKIIND